MSSAGEKRDVDNEDPINDCKKFKSGNGGKSEDHVATEHVVDSVPAKIDEKTSNSVKEARLTEIDVGITEYVGNHVGFKGVIKQRYSDFVVTEIDLEGKLARLDNNDIPKEENNLPEMDEILDKDTIVKLRCLSDDAEKTLSVDIDVENFEKDRRRIVHEIVRSCFENLESNTEDKDGRKTIVVTRSKGSSKGFHGKNYKFQKGIRQSWPSFRGNYTHFTLYKENVDTIESINIISKYLGMKPGTFTYAGVKDKRAKTFQRVSVYRTEAIKLLSLNKHLRNMLIGNIEYFKDPLKLGDLSGNRFQIVLRNVAGSSEIIEIAMKCLSEIGFLNYYGMQRFGTTSVPTHAIGLALLKGDWKLAVELILKPRPGEDESTTQSRKLWLDTEDATKAFALLKRKNSNEGYLLRGLQTHGTKDLVNALNFIPRNMRLMYIHSYQSYVWNRIVSRRIKKYGLVSVEGDLVLKDDDVIQVGENLGEVCEDENIQEVKTKLDPIVLQSGQTCSIYDIVLPLVGYDVKYPNNEIADWYRELLSEDGLDIDNMRHRVKSYALSGSYRRMIVRPKTVNWFTLRYDDPKISLVRTDYDNLKNETNEDLNSNDGAFQAVKMDFILPSSCYATMALREVLRIDTSSAFQSNLNQI